MVGVDMRVSTLCVDEEDRLIAARLMEWVTPRTLTLPWGSENVRVANDDPDPEVVADCDFVVEYVLVTVRVLLRGEEIESVVVGVIVDTYVSRLCVDEEDRLRRSVAVIAARLMEGVRP
jgi:hypothetical protein